MQFERRCSALRQSVGVSDGQRQPVDTVAPARLQAVVSTASLFALLALGVVPAPVRTVASAEAQRCTAPAFWDVFEQRCKVYMCAEGWTRDDNTCRKSGEYPAYAASCPVGWGVRAVDWGVHGHSMRCVDPSPPPPPPTSTVVISPAPPGTIRPADPPTAPVVSVTRVHTLPFAVSETGAGEKSYEFSLDSGTEVSVSLTGMDKDIDCRVNTSSCTNHGGTSADSWGGTLQSGTHTVTVYPFGGGSGNWTLSVSGTAGAPPVVPPPSTPSSPPTTVRRVLETRVGLVYSTEADSPGRTYSFTLESRQTVNVSLTGMDRDFDCSVNGSRCSNRGGTRDDDWSGELAAGSHSIRVYPYLGGRSDYTVMAIVNCPAGHFAFGGSCHRYVPPTAAVSPVGGGGPEVMSCDGDTELPDGQECVDGKIVFSEDIVVVNTPIPVPPLEIPIPPGSGPGEGDPGPGQAPEPGDNGGGGGTTPPGVAPGDMADGITQCGKNINGNQDYGPRPDGSSHSGIDIGVASSDAVFYAYRGGTVSLGFNTRCGYYVDVGHTDGSSERYCHLDEASRPSGGTIGTGDAIGSYGPSGRTDGPHLHISSRGPDGMHRNPVGSLWTLEEMLAAGFTFDEDGC